MKRIYKTLIVLVFLAICLALGGCVNRGLNREVIDPATGKVVKRLSLTSGILGSDTQTKGVSLYIVDSNNDDFVFMLYVDDANHSVNVEYAKEVLKGAANCLAMGTPGLAEQVIASLAADSNSK